MLWYVAVGRLLKGHRTVYDLLEFSEERSVKSGHGYIRVIWNHNTQNLVRLLSANALRVSQPI